MVRELGLEPSWPQSQCGALPYMLLSGKSQCRRNRTFLPCADLRYHIRGGIEPQQPYQGVVPLFGDQKEKLEKLSEVLEHYMLQSEQLDTTLVLAANMDVAAGVLIQRLPLEGAANLAGKYDSVEREAALGQSEDYNRISILAKSLKAEELLGLDIETVLHRLFWEEPLLRFEPLVGDTGPRFRCSCSRERVGRMIKGLGVEEVESILSERDNIEVGCEFCGKQYHFDPVDAASLFTQPEATPPTGPSVH